MPKSVEFTIHCKKCSRLHNYLRDSKKKYPDYYCKPVPAFGDSKAKLLIVGLAPGLHGANATGRPFTGDYAGVLLYETLYKHGFSNQTESRALDDGLELKDCRITNAVKCVPPENKPTTQEARTCNQYLQKELREIDCETVVLALGKIAHDSVLRAIGERLAAYPFAHAAKHEIDGHFILIDSYHCSRYNTQTKRLTPEQFDKVFELIRSLI